MEHRWVLVLAVATLPLFVLAQETGQCYSAADITGSVLGTFLSTLAAVAIAFIVYWYMCRKRRAKAHLNRGVDGDVEAHAYDNPYFQDDEPDKAALPDSTTTTTAENGKAVSEVVHKAPNEQNKAPTSGKGKKNKPSITNPFVRSKGTTPARALDDSCLHQEPERVEVSLRGCDFTGLGFNICGNIRDGIYVKDVLHRGPASESGKIKAGDRIMSVNVSFDNITIEDALTILSYASPYEVTLELQKTSDQLGFIPGHQKKGSTASSASTSLSASGDRLSHPMYRSQSSDDVSQLGRDAAGTKRSLSVGVPAKLKKDALVKPSHSLREETISEGDKSSLPIESSEPKRARFSSDKDPSGSAEIKVVVHKEEKPTVIEMPEEKPKSSSGGLGSLKRLGNQIGEFVKEIVSPSSSTENPQPKKEDETKRTKEPSARQSTNPFEVDVDVVPDNKKHHQSKSLQATVTAQVPSVSVKVDVPKTDGKMKKDAASSVEGKVNLPSGKLHSQLPEVESAVTKSNSDKGLMLDVEEQLAKVGVSLTSGAVDVSKHSQIQPNAEIPDVSVTIVDSLPAIQVQFPIAEVQVPNVENVKNSETLTDNVRSGIEDVRATDIKVDLPTSGLIWQDMPTDKKNTTDALLLDVTCSSVAAATTCTSIVAENTSPNASIELQSPVKELLQQSAAEVAAETASEINAIFQKVDKSLDDVKTNLNGKLQDVSDMVTEANATVDTVTEDLNRVENELGNIKCEDLVEVDKIDALSTNLKYGGELKVVPSNITISGIEVVDSASNFVDEKKPAKHERNKSKGSANGHRNGIADFDGIVIAMPSITGDGDVAEISAVPPTKTKFSVSDILSDAKTSAEEIIQATIAGLQQNPTHDAPTIKAAEVKGSVFHEEVVLLPRVEIKTPSAADFAHNLKANTPTDASGTENKSSPSDEDKSPSPPPSSAKILEATLNENINYFETKMQSALQKSSPKTKPKRTSTPGKRRAPPPPDGPAANHVAVSEVSYVSGNPFVVGLNSSYNSTTDVAIPKGENVSVVFMKPNNVTTVQVNADITPANADTKKDVLAPEKNSIDESKGKKMNIKSDGGFGFGFRKTNFFEGLDKAGNEDQPKKENTERFHSIPRTGISIQNKSKLTVDENSPRKSSSLGDLTKIVECNSNKPLLLERAVSMDLNGPDDASGQLGETKLLGVDSLGQQGSSGETLLSNADSEPIKMDVRIFEDTPKTNGDSQDLAENKKKQDLEEWIDKEQSSKHSHKKFNIIPGFFKKDKGQKRKKKEAAMTNSKSKIPVAVVGTSNKTEGETDPATTVNSENNVLGDNCKSGIFEVELSEREMSLSSSSLSGDSLEEEKDAQPQKRRMITVDASLKTDLPGDSEELNSTYEEVVWKRETPSPITFPIIPPIISSIEKRDLRPSSVDKDGSKVEDNFLGDGLTINQPRVSSNVRSLSPTKFPRIWPATEERKENGESDDHNGNGSDPFQFNYNIGSSNNDAVTVTTMHITKSTMNTVQHDTYTAYPVTSDGSISKTVIIATPQLSMQVVPASNNAVGPESPPPTLQPPPE